jgi:hypothetical protein
MSDAPDTQAGDQMMAADGFAVVRNVLSEAEIEGLVRNLAEISEHGPGTRTLLERTWCFQLSEHLKRDARLSTLLPRNAFAAQCTLFTKAPDQNWLVSFHQDLAIPVDKRVSSSDCTGWSEKEGSVFVQPPVSVLETLVAVRVHLDDCDSANGALRVVPGTHRLGRLGRQAAASEREHRGETCVSLLRGDALVMKPLLLHASSKTVSARARRVLHFVFGPPTLPSGLAWAQTGR